MDLNKKINAFIVSVAFSLFVIINIFLDMIGSIQNASLDIVVKIALKALTFSVLHYLVTRAYKLYWFRKKKSVDLSGEWYHVHLIHGQDSYLRAGTVQISQNYYYLSLTGQNNHIRYNEDSDSCYISSSTTTTWHEIAVIRPDARSLEGVYTAQRNFDDQTTRKGIHNFTFYYEGNRPTQMLGSFYDASPYNRAGSISLFRNKAARDAYILDQCRRVAMVSADRRISQ